MIKLPEIRDVQLKKKSATCGLNTIKPLRIQVDNHRRAQVMLKFSGFTVCGRHCQAASAEGKTQRASHP